MSEVQDKQVLLEFLYNSTSPDAVETISNIGSYLKPGKERVQMPCGLIKADGYINYSPGPRVLFNSG